MVGRVLWFYVLSVVINVALHYAAKLVKARKPNAPFDSFIYILLSLVSSIAIIHLLAWVFSNEFILHDIAITAGMALVSCMFCAVIYRSYDPVRRPWIFNGFRITLELIYNSVFYNASRIVYAVLFGVVSHLFIVVNIWIYWPLSNYNEALRIVFLFYFLQLVIPSLMLVSVLKHPVLDDGSRLRLALILLCIASPALVLSALSGVTEPVLHSFRIGNFDFSVTVWTLAVLLFCIIIYLIPALFGSQSRQRLQLDMLEWENKFSSKCESIFKEAAGLPDTKNIERLANELASRKHELAAEAFTPTQFLYGLAMLSMAYAEPMDEDEDLPSYRALRLIYRKILRITPPIDSWCTRTGWSNTLAEFEEIDRCVRIAIRLGSKDIRRLVDGTRGNWPKLLVWTPGLLNWCIHRLERRMVSYADSFSAKLFSLASIPEDDPRWRHIIWLNSIEGRIRDFSDKSQLRVGASGAVATVASGVQLFVDERERSAKEQKDVRDTKRIGGRLLMPLLPIVLALIAAWLKTALGL
ncbi:hypothetical protein IEE92_13460 [Kocuria sp. cx-116]|uniref:hypothetical protein n=1 Tax=Kocuria sp. cx-116 TaxID=2771378 RepID=UPI001688F5EB|nr:hypothetical protein [Kocuria sp. cx-116]MBD2763536.1 hypothetical protein [Kocuria sp. cx-116]